MKYLLIPIIAMLAVSCAPKVATIPKAPIVAESALPDLENAQTGIDSSLDDNEKIAKQLDHQKKIIEDQKNEIDKAIASAEIIKEKAENDIKITKEETFLLVDQLNKVKDRNMFLELESEKLRDTNNNQNKILKQTKKDAQESLKKLVLKENEAAELRAQNEHLSDNLEIKNREVVKLTKKLATANVYRNWILAAVGLVILYFIIGAVLKYIKPL